MITPPDEAYEIISPEVVMCIKHVIDTHGIIVQHFTKDGWVGKVECRYKTGEVSGYLTNEDKKIFCLIGDQDLACTKITWGHRSYNIVPIPTRTP